jgi:hypothetical protein
MKIVIPYAQYGLPGLVSVALQYDCPEPIVFHCEHDSSYYRLVRNLWHDGETFIIVEHDIIPWPGAVTILDQCSQPWCLNPYNNQTDGSLGCTKFGKTLLTQYPDALDEPFFRHYDKSWAMLDGYVYDKLTSLGVDRHIHKPNVAHLHAHESKRRGII